MTAPLAISATLAAFPSLVDLPGPATGLPIAALLVVAVQLGGVLLARELEVPRWGRVWLLALAASAVLLPLLALHAATSRVPYVAWSRGSAGAVVWSSVGAAVALVGLVALTAAISADAPEQASLLFAPVAVLVPAVLGAPGDLDERSALAALARAFAVAAPAVFVGWLLPRGAQPLVGPLTLAAAFGGFWLLGYRPSFPPDRGDVVPILASALVVVTVLATVLVPPAALTARRVLRAAREGEEGDE